MNKFLPAIALFLLPFATMAQRNYLLTLDQLFARIDNGRDTTFVVNLWATWCAPCIKELPCFEQLQANNNQQKLKVLLVSVDFKTELTNGVIPFVQKRKLQNEVWLLDEPDQQLYINRIDKNWSGAIPATLFIKAGQRLFYEKAFTCTELAEAYKNFTL